MIREAIDKDIAMLLKLTGACGRHMIDQGIYQWNEHYPSIEAFVSDLNRNALWVYELNGLPVGCISFYTEIDPEYQDMPWLTPDTKHLYIHRLAVHPDYQKKNIARTLMDFAENKACELRCDSVRLDTFSQNPRNLKFYAARGYKETGGKLYFPKQSVHPFITLELLLD